MFVKANHQAGLNKEKNGRKKSIFFSQIKFSKYTTTTATEAANFF